MGDFKKGGNLSNGEDDFEKGVGLIPLYVL